MAVPARGQGLSGREEALAREVAEHLKPILAEMDRKLDSILQKVSDLLARLDKDSIDDLLAQLEAAARRDSAREPRGSQEQ
jgi:hypothetical protein